MSTAFFFDKDDIEVNRQHIAQVQRAAKQDPLRRARLCLHHDYNDKVQEMIIAVCRDSYICPHRQLHKYKTYTMIKGSMLVPFFDDDGRVVRKIKMGEMTSREVFIHRFSSNQWHTVVPLSDIVVYIETIAGPYVKDETEWATWGPKEGDADGIEAFLSKIINSVSLR